MRTYFAPAGKLDDLLARFRDHTTKLFAKHGMTNVGYFVPLDNQANKMMYVLRYPGRAAREKSWAAFSADPDWKKAKEASEANGKLVDKVESIFLQTTDFSPALPRLPVRTKMAPRVFELRTYKASPGNLPNLLTRFRDHTTELFAKHGMTNLIYWTYTDKDQGADDMLIYLLAHPSQEAGLAAFKAFGNDTDWQTALKASEAKAGGSLTTSVESEYWKALNFSPLR